MEIAGQQSGFERLHDLQGKSLGSSEAEEIDSEDFTEFLAYPSLRDQIVEPCLNIARLQEQVETQTGFQPLPT